MMQRIAIGVIWTALLVGGCTVGEDELASEATGESRRLRTPRLIQPGQDILLLAVTEDNFALYQEGQTVYATELTGNAERTVVAEVPGTNMAFPLHVGKVVFVWTDPQRDLPGFGVSPLVLWTADRGPRLISAQSAVGLVATAASSDSRQIVFTTNVPPDGLRGDLAYARTRDALSPTILLRDIPLDFPFGRCRPLAGFGGSGEHSFPIATYCAGADTTATLSKWVHGVKTDLIANIATPLPFTLESDPQGTTFLVNLADATVATVTARGDVSIIDTVPALRGFVTRRGTVAYTTPGAGGAALELRVALHGRSPHTVGPLVTLYSNRYNRGGYYKSRIASPDTSLALFGSSRDPSTGLTDMNLLDLRSGAAIPLDTSTRTTVGNEIFTSDSKYALYFVVTDPQSSTGDLFAANRDGSRQISSGGGVFDALRAAGSDVSYTENPVFNPAREFLLSTGDLVVADVSDPTSAPRLVSSQANLFYLPSHDRRRLVFATANEADGPGLYLASARP